MHGGWPVILGYHGVAEMGREHDPLGLYVSPRALAGHVSALQRRGFEFLKMAEFADRMDDGHPPGRGVVALTFDDGTVDHATVLPGVLEELGVPATVYVCPGLAGAPYPWSSEEAGVRFMTEVELVELARHPLIEIGSHTNEHRVLGRADAPESMREMVACKQTLEGLIGTEVLSFCYPRCEYSGPARDSVPRAGYTNAVTCGLRGSWNLFELKREVMHNSDGRLVVWLKLRGRYSSLGGSLLARFVRGVAIITDRITGGLSG